tara:strand:- start:195 stop:509 length:315 start_codon:yes stop_codon:yes gene_type:complete
MAVLFYQVYGTGHDPLTIVSVKTLDQSGYEYALTFLDKSPEMQVFVGKKYRWPQLPLVVKCDINGDEEVIGGLVELKEHLGINDDEECKPCEAARKKRLASRKL